MFTHKQKGRPDHQHETVAQARLCEQNRRGGNDIQTDTAGSTRSIVHQDPCVCGPYDRCAEVRVADVQRSGNWRDRFRAYND